MMLIAPRAVRPHLEFYAYSLLKSYQLQTKVRTSVGPALMLACASLRCL